MPKIGFEWTLEALTVLLKQSLLVPTVFLALKRASLTTGTFTSMCHLETQIYTYLLEVAVVSSHSQKGGQ